MIAGGEYPDFIDGSDGMQQLYEAGALIALDDYLDDYPNIKNYLTETQWDKLRRDDGHIYWINQFSARNGKDMTTTHNDEAFWIQVRVLEWAGYPRDPHDGPVLRPARELHRREPDDGGRHREHRLHHPVRRLALLLPGERAQFLDGYPNDGSVIVKDGTTIVDYNTTPTAKAYFGKLNEEFHKGIVDPESFTQTYDEYIAKLSTGRVLGMIDQWWNFAYSVNDSLKVQGLEEQGCNYVPLPITISEDIKNQWHTTGLSGDNINEASGIGITTSCEDIEGALSFINGLLDQEVLDLRSWGVEGVDYNVDENGVYYRTDEQRAQVADTAYKASHLCGYSYFPGYGGESFDGINAMKPEEQPQEFLDSLPDKVAACLEAYGCSNYVDMLGNNEIPASGTRCTPTPTT